MDTIYKQMVIISSNTTKTFPSILQPHYFEFSFQQTIIYTDSNDKDVRQLPYHSALEVELLEEVSNSSLGLLLLVLVLLQVATSNPFPYVLYLSWKVLAIFFRASFFSAASTFSLGRAEKSYSTVYLTH